MKVSWCDTVLDVSGSQSLPGTVHQPAEEDNHRIKHWSERVVAIEVISHALHDVFKQLDLPDLLYVTIQRLVFLRTCNIESF